MSTKSRIEAIERAIERIPPTGEKVMVRNRGADGQIPGLAGLFVGGYLVKNAAGYYAVGLDAGPETKNHERIAEILNGARIRMEKATNEHQEQTQSD